MTKGILEKKCKKKIVHHILIKRHEISHCFEIIVFKVKGVENIFRVRLP